MLIVNSKHIPMKWSLFFVPLCLSAFVSKRKQNYFFFFAL